MAVVTLDLTAFRNWAAADRAEFVRAYAKAIGSRMDASPVGRIMRDICTALVATASTVDIDMTGADVRDQASVTYLLDGFGEVAPKEQPPDMFRAFIRAMQIANPQLAARRRNDGKPAV